MGPPLLIAFPLAAYALLYLLADPSNGRRAAIIHAAVLWGVATLAITEALSLSHALTATGLAAAWTLVDLAAAGWLWRRGMTAFIQRAKLDALETALLAGILFLLAGAGAVALIAPPNTTDAMVYHLPRIVNWLHNRGVWFYATHEIRQLQMPPWAEYAMLQFHGLSGGDRFDNLVQWFSLAGSAAGVSLIAGRLGAGRRGQALAAVLCATIPEGLLEASGAKNDYVLAFWLVALVYYLLRFAQDGGLRNACGIGAALGLACLTKATAFVLAPPLIASIVVLARAAGQSKSAPSKIVWMRGLAVAALLALGVNTPHFIRNYRLFHSVLGIPPAPSAAFQYTNASFGARPLLSNVLRNLALDAGTPLPPVNRAMESGIIRVLGAVGENANDPRTTWDGTRFHVPPFTLTEATAGNPLHAALILLACAILLRRRQAAANRPALLLAIGLIAAFLLFCAVLRWQPWHTRLHLPLFVLWAAVIGTLLADSWSRGATAALGMLLLLSAASQVLANQLRPLVGGSWNILSTPRQDLYFADFPDAGDKVHYQDAVQFLESSGCPEIGLDLSQGGNEYPFYALLNDSSGSRSIRNVYVTNQSGVYENPALPRPVCLICPGCVLKRPGWPVLARQYRLVKLFGNISVLTDPDHAGALPNACTAEFSGWYDVEKNAGDWWRWSSRKGVIHVRASQALKANLEAVIRSARYPNQVELLVNGASMAVLNQSSASPEQAIWIAVELREGDNTLEFVSQNPPVQLPRDSRWLAIELRNPAFRASGPAGCAVDPN